MARNRSDYTITFDKGGEHEFVLLALNDYYEDELQLPWTATTDSCAPLESGGTLNFNRGGVSREFEIQVYKDFDSFVEARNSWLTRQATMPDVVNATLTIEVEGGLTFEIESCVIKGGNGKVIKGPTFRTWEQFRLVGGKLKLAA